METYKNDSNLKMYILIKDDVPDNFVPVIAAHTALGTYLVFEYDIDMVVWKKFSFKKVVCTVNQKEFDNIKKSEYKHKVFTESALGGREVAIGVFPTEDVKPFKFFKLWKPTK
jgi:hypothetical protein